MTIIIPRGFERTFTGRAYICPTTGDEEAPRVECVCIGDRNVQTVAWPCAFMDARGLRPNERNYDRNYPEWHQDLLHTPGMYWTPYTPLGGDMEEVKIVAPVVTAEKPSLEAKQLARALKSLEDVDEFFYFCAHLFDDLDTNEGSVALIANVRATIHELGGTPHKGTIRADFLANAVVELV